MESILTRDHVDALLNLAAGEPSTADLARVREVAVELNHATVLREQILFETRLTTADVEALIDERVAGATDAELDQPLSSATTVSVRALCYLDLVINAGVRALFVAGELDEIEAALVHETVAAVSAAAIPVLLGETAEKAEPTDTNKVQLTGEESDLFYSIFSAAREDAYFGKYAPEPGSPEEDRFYRSYALQDKLMTLLGIGA